MRSDTLKLENGLVGIATYSAVDSSGIKMFNGPFRFQHNTLDTNNIEGVRALIYEGRFDAGKKNGSWKFEIDELIPQGEAFVDDLKIVQRAKGQRTMIRANFKNGLAENYWTVHKTKVNQSVDVDSSFYAKAFFSKNAMLSSFLAWSDSLSIIGQINESGFLHGEWAFRHQTSSGAFVNEFRVYEAGILKKHSFVIDGKEIQIAHFGMDASFDNDQEEWVDFNLEDSYFSILHESVVYKNTLDEMDLKKALQMSEKASKFFNYALMSFRLSGDLKIWKIQKTDVIIQTPKVRVRKYSYTAEEKEKIQKALDLLGKAKKTAKAFLDNPQVEINRHSIEEIAHYHAALKVFNEEINKLNRILAKLNTPTFEYLNREEILPQLLDNVFFPGQLSYSFNDSLRQPAFNFPKALENKDMHISGLYAFAVRVHDAVQKCHEEVNPIVQRNKTKAQLAQLEEKLVQTRDSLQSLYSNTLKRDDFNNLHLRFQKTTLAQIEQIFVEYGKQELNQRLESINQVIADLENFFAFYKDLVDIKRNILDIDERYTRVVWNPYTFTDMEETVKERLYFAYKNHLLTHLLNRLEQTIYNGAMAETKSHFDALFEKMKTLREVDTKDLERALRRQTNPRTIAELLELNFDF